MSVIEPEINAKEREEDESLMHSDVKNMDDMILTENFDSEQKQTSEEPKVSSKKRKSKKSKESSSKKVRGVAYTKVDAISLQAWKVSDAFDLLLYLLFSDWESVL